MEPETQLALVNSLAAYPVLTPEWAREIKALGPVMDDDLPSYLLTQYRVSGGGALQWVVQSEAGESTADSVEGIVLHVGKWRGRWAGRFGEGESAPPLCQSDDWQIGHGDPGGECLECPFDQWGSADVGQGKACRQYRPTFLLRPGDELPVLIRVPSGSFAHGFDRWRAKVSLRRPWSFVTRFSLRRVKSKAGITYAAVAPELVGRLTPEQTQAVRAYGQTLAVCGLFTTAARAAMQTADRQEGAAEVDNKGS